MASSPTDIDRYYAVLADMAESLRLEILSLPDEEARSAHVCGLVERSEMVFGVWPDGHEAGGYGFHLIKGPDRAGAGALALPEASNTAAIPCSGWRQAVSAQEVWGEPKAVAAPKKRATTTAPRRKRKTRARVAAE